MTTINILLASKLKIPTSEIDMSGIDFLYDEKTLPNCTDFEGNRVDIPSEKHSTPINFTKYIYLVFKLVF